jgi:hypothetical protein
MTSAATWPIGTEFRAASKVSVQQFNAGWFVGYSLIGHI